MKPHLMIATAALALLLGCGAEDPPSATAPTAPAKEAAAPQPEPAPTPPPAPAPPSEPEPEGAESAASGTYPCIDGDATKGAQKYALFCASCHGAGGEGDGPAAGGLEPKPAKHTDGAYMNGVTNEYLHKVIAEGGAAVGKSPLMAPWAGALSGPELWDVVAYVRTLAVPPYSCP
jgi:mono/diheme cytochrome c family protein